MAEATHISLQRSLPQEIPYQVDTDTPEPDGCILSAPAALLGGCDREMNARIDVMESLLLVGDKSWKSQSVTGLQDMMELRRQMEIAGNCPIIEVPDEGLQVIQPTGSLREILSTSIIPNGPDQQARVMEKSTVGSETDVQPGTSKDILGGQPASQSKPNRANPMKQSAEAKIEQVSGFKLPGPDLVKAGKFATVGTRKKPVSVMENRTMESKQTKGKNTEEKRLASKIPGTVQQLTNNLYRNIPVSEGTNDYFINGGYITLDRLPVEPESQLEEGEICDEEEDPVSREEEELTDKGESGLNLADTWGVGTVPEPPIPEPVVIFRVEEAAPWDTLVDGKTKTNSTGLPRYLIVAKIKSEGPNLGPALPEWMTRKRGYSLQILHDGVLDQWPDSDTKCALVSKKPTVTLKSWMRCIRAAQIRFRGHTVLIWLSAFRDMTSTGQIKNALAAMTRAVRSAVGEERRVFICDFLIGRRENVLGLTTPCLNQMLREACDTLRITHHVPKVFLAPMAEQFHQKFGNADRYVQHDGQLTKLGCLQYRAQLFRELGFTAYHMDE